MIGRLVWSRRILDMCIGMLYARNSVYVLARRYKPRRVVMSMNPASYLGELMSVIRDV